MQRFERDGCLEHDERVDTSRCTVHNLEELRSGRLAELDKTPKERIERLVVAAGRLLSDQLMAPVQLSTAGLKRNQRERSGFVQPRAAGSRLRPLPC